MGLDNGIVVKTSDKNILDKLESHVIGSPTYFSNGTELEVCYWRKCWGLRNDILNILGSRFSDEWKTVMNEDDITNVIHYLNSLNERRWHSSIWEFKEMKSTLKKQVKILKRVRKLMSLPDLSVYFYDSY